MQRITDFGSANDVFVKSSASFLSAFTQKRGGVISRDCKFHWSWFGVPHNTNADERRARGTVEPTAWESSLISVFWLLKKKTRL